MKDIFVKTAHQRILNFFLARPTGWFYGSEIAKKTGVSSGRVSNVLKDLSVSLLLEKDVRGKTELYRVLMDSPALRAFKVLNTVVSIAPLVESLSRFSTRIILYGSSARGVNIEGSDLDLLVVSVSRDNVLSSVLNFPRRSYYGFSEIKPVVKKTEEWAFLESNDPVFYNEVQKGILLYERKIDEQAL